MLKSYKSERLSEILTLQGFGLRLHRRGRVLLGCRGHKLPEEMSMKLSVIDRAPVLVITIMNLKSGL
jgi:hypothetical protein